MPLDAQVLHEIDSFVRGGFETRSRIIEILCEEMYEPGELEEAEISAAVDAAFAVREIDKNTWPPVTDCNKLQLVFAELNRRGIVALQNAGYTQSDGYEDVGVRYEQRPGRDSIRGYCFYHGQDLQSAVDGGGLYLSFGPMNAQEEKTRGPKVGALIVEELERAGFLVQWNGTFSQRIQIPNIDWKRR